MAKKEETKVEELESVGRALSNTEAFIEKNQKIILIGVGVVVLVVLAVMAFRNFYQKLSLGSVFSSFSVSFDG